MVPLVFCLPSYTQGLLFVLVTNSNAQTHIQCWATLVPTCDGQTWKWPGPTLVYTPVESSLSGRRVLEYRDSIPLIRLLTRWRWDHRRGDCPGGTRLNQVHQRRSLEAPESQPHSGEEGPPAGWEQPLTGSQLGAGRRDVACRQD